MGTPYNFQLAYKTKQAEDRNKAKNELALKTLSELSYILGRYCGPSNYLLSEKTFGYHMPTDLVEELIAAKSFEEEFLSTPEETQTTE